MKLTLDKKRIIRLKPKKSICQDYQPDIINFTPQQLPINLDPYKQLLLLECQSTFSRVNHNAQLVSKVVKQVIQRHYQKPKYYKNSFNEKKWMQKKGIGWICAHVTYHYGSNIQQCIEISVMLLKMIQQNPKQHCVLYGQQCVKFHSSDMPPLLLSMFQMFDVKNIVNRYLSSLLLEYLPVEYSGFIINLYLEDSKNNKNNRFNPKQFYRLICSVIHFIMMTRKPINAEHVENLCLSCYMGIIEWPIVISNRQLFDNSSVVVNI